MKNKRISILALFLLMSLILEPFGSVFANAASTGTVFFQTNTGVKNSAKKNIPAPFNNSHSNLYAKILQVGNTYYVTYCNGYNDSLNGGDTIAKTSNPKNRQKNNGSGHKTMSDTQKQLVGLASAAGFGGYKKGYNSRMSAITAINNNQEDYVATQIAIWICAHGYYGSANKRKLIYNHLTSNLTKRDKIRNKIKEIFKTIGNSLNVVSYSKKTKDKATTYGMEKQTNGSYKVTLEDKNNAYSKTKVTALSNEKFTTSKSGNKLTVRLPKSAVPKNNKTTVTLTKTIPGGKCDFYQSGTKQALSIANDDFTIKSYCKTSKKKYPDKPKKEQKWNIPIKKSDNSNGTKTIQGIPFSLWTKDEDGEYEIVSITNKQNQPVVCYDKTDENGYVELTDIPPGTYWLRECDENGDNDTINTEDYIQFPDQKIVLPNKTVDGTNGNIEYETIHVTNNRCKFRVRLHKKINKNNIAGSIEDISPKGAVYGLYNYDGEDCEDGEEAISLGKATELTRFTTNEKGSVISDEVDYQSSRNYFVKEIKPPTGCKLSDEIIEIDFINKYTPDYEEDDTSTGDAAIDEDEQADGETVKTESTTVEFDPLGIGYNDITVYDDINTKSISIQKIDKETNNPILGKGFGFQILDANHNILFYMDKETNEKKDIFYTNELGIAKIDIPLSFGTYYIKEVKTIAPYVLNSTLKEFKINDTTKSETVETNKYWVVNNNSGTASLKKEQDVKNFIKEHTNRDELKGTYTLTFANQRQKGSIELHKYGNIFSSVTINGKEHIPTYTYDYLKGVSFDVYEDLREFNMSADEFMLQPKQKPIATITTDAFGVAKLSDLDLGKYILCESKTVHGYSIKSNGNYTNPKNADSITGPAINFTNEKMDSGDIDSTEKKKVDQNNKAVQDQSNNGYIYVELSYSNRKKEVSTTTTCLNETCLMRLSLAKAFSDNGGTLTDVTFGLFANEDLRASDGTIIKKDSLIKTIYIDEFGLGNLNMQIPYGKYYVKEMTTSNGYQLDDTKHCFNFHYNGAEEQEIIVNNGDEIINTPIDEEKIIYEKEDDPDDDYSVVKIDTNKHKTSHSSNVKTGDDTPTFLYLASLIVSFIGLTITLFIFTRKKNKKIE